MERLRDWIRDQTGLVQTSDIALLVLLLLGASLLDWRSGEVAHDKPVAEISTITRFGAYESQYDPGMTFVSAQDQQGLVGGTAVQPDRIAGCHVGDKVRAQRLGVSLTLDPEPCPIKLRADEIETLGPHQTTSAK